MNHVLVLNADWSPLQVLPWERVICLVLDSKVAVVADYEGRQIRSPGRPDADGAQRTPRNSRRSRLAAETAPDRARQPRIRI